MYINLSVLGKSGLEYSDLVFLAAINQTETEWLTSLKGKDGANGYTPIRGTDYWTTADINAMHDYINAQIENGAW